jgi:hypothetical protein
LRTALTWHLLKVGEELGVKWAGVDLVATGSRESIGGHATMTTRPIGDHCAAPIRSSASSARLRHATTHARPSRLTRGAVVVALAAGGLAVVPSLGLRPALAAEIIPGEVIVVDFNAGGGNGALLRVNLSTGAQTTVSAGDLFRAPFGVTADGAGNLLVADKSAFTENGGVIKVHPTTGEQSAVTSERSFINPSGLVLDANGDILVVDADALAGLGAVIRVDPDTNVQTVVSSGGFFGNPSGIALEADGDILVVDPDGLNGAGAVFRIDPQSGQQSVVSSAGTFGNPSGIAVESTGRILVVDPDLLDGDGGVVRVDPVTGAQGVVASGGTFGNPTGIALLPNGLILVADPDAFGGNGGIIAVHPTSNAIIDLRTTVASGGSFRDPVGIVLAPVPPAPAPAATGPYAPASYPPPALGSPSCTSSRYAVPPGVTKLGFEVVADGGDPGLDGSPLSGSHSGGSGGFGAMAVGELTVTAGQVIYANVGYNFTGGQGSGGGGFGGEMSFLTSDPGSLTATGTLSPLAAGGCQVNSFLVIAAGGGGGGAGDYTFGGTGGNGGGLIGDNGRSGGSGSTSENRPGRGGGGATQVEGGSGGPGSGIGESGRSGTAQVGGRGGDSTPGSCDLPVGCQDASEYGDGGGAGGGGGLFGGGGGGVGTLAGGGGGGGGSSYLHPQVVSSGGLTVPARTRTTPPSITLTPLGVATSTIVVAHPDPADLGQPVTFMATVDPAPAVSPTPRDPGSVTFIIDGSPVGTTTVDTATGTAASPPLTQLTVGGHTVEARYAGNGFLEASTGTASVVITQPDISPPAVAVEQAMGQADPTNVSPVNFAVTFSEPVTGFGPADVSLGAGTAGGTLAATVSGGPSVYSISVSGMTTPGTVVATVPAGAAVDGAGNLSTASASGDNIVTFDATAPTVACSADPAVVRSNNHKLATIRVTVTAADGGSAVPFILVSVTSNQADSGLGTDDVAGDIQGWATGTPDTTGEVRMERYRTDRIYTLTYSATDAAGNTAPCLATVAVRKR